jgi:hypothetical protein
MTDVNAQNSAANKFNNELTATGDYVMISASRKQLTLEFENGCCRRLNGSIKGKIGWNRPRICSFHGPEFYHKGFSDERNKVRYLRFNHDWLPGDEAKSKGCHFYKRLLIFSIRMNGI